MKRLRKICLSKQNVLNCSEMKNVKGGRSGRWCNVNGEWVGPLSCYNDADCERLYGKGDTCES